MKNQLSQQPKYPNATTLSPKDIETLESVAAIPHGTPPNVIEFFSRACGETGLSPFRRQIYLIKRGDKYTIQTGIDGYRTIADRTGRYAGSDDPVYVLQDREPIAATVTVWKIVANTRCPFTSTARWREYFPGEQLGFQWRKMPFLMLGKCAEALALRKAFPEETSGIYTEDEMTIEREIPIERPKFKPLEVHPVQEKTVASGGKEPDAGVVHTPTEAKPNAPAAASPPKKKPKVWKKTESPSETAVGPNQKAVLDRLDTVKMGKSELVTVSKHLGALQPDEGWEDLDESDFKNILHPDCWPLIQDRLEQLDN